MHCLILWSGAATGEKRQNLVLVPKYTKIQFFGGSAPNPAGGAYSAPPDSLAGGEGARWLLPKNPTPALQPFGLRPSGLASSPHFLDRGYAYALSMPAATITRISETFNHHPRTAV